MLPAVSTHEAPALSEEQIDQVLRRTAEAYGQQMRSPIMHLPSEAGLDYQDVTFTATDGVPLEAWYIPAPGSDRLIIANHPRGFSRSGLPAHLEPWKSIWSPSGNGFEVNFIPDYKILHDAGYNILTYDLRNHGHSSAANGGIVSSGLFEARDVVGSLRYVRGRPDTQDMTLGLFSRCLGCNSTFVAMSQHPGDFEGVRCLVAPEPLTPSVIAEKLLGLAGVPLNRMADLDARVVVTTGIDFGRRDPKDWVKGVRVPSFIYQVRDDVLSDRDDMQVMFDNIPVADKHLQWIEDSPVRWDGYLEFQRRPEPMLAWFEKSGVSISLP